MRYSVNWLKEEIKNGLSPDYLFFWGHTQKQEGVIDKSCFSQWFPAAFTVEGVVYPTAEHWMMEGKALFFNDTQIAEEIRRADKPAIAKQLGRKVRNFDAKKWQEACYDIVVKGNLHKFSQHEELKQFLLQTGNKVIVEASPVDPVWGIGMAQDHSSASNPLNWKGTNLLGFVLMEVRDMLGKHQ